MNLFDTAMKIAREEGKEALSVWYLELTNDQKNEFHIELGKIMQQIIEAFENINKSFTGAFVQVARFMKEMAPVLEHLEKKDRARRRYQRRYDRIRKSLT